MLKGVKAAGHEEQRKTQFASFQEEPLHKSWGVRSCLNNRYGEISYNPQELKDHMDLAEVVYFKSGTPGPCTKGNVWAKSRETHAQYPHHAFKAAIMTHAVSHWTHPLVKYIPNLYRQLFKNDTVTVLRQSSHWPAIHYKAQGTRQNESPVLQSLKKEQASAAVCSLTRQLAESLSKSSGRIEHDAELSKLSAHG